MTITCEESSGNSDPGNPGDPRCAPVFWESHTFQERRKAEVVGGGWLVYSPDQLY